MAKWPLQRFPPGAQPEAMKVSISVYEGPERSAIVQLLRIMGARYTSKLNRKNTHLICREAEVAIDYGALFRDLRRATDAHMARGLRTAFDQRLEAVYSLTTIASS